MEASQSFLLHTIEDYESGIARSGQRAAKNKKTGPVDPSIHSSEIHDFSPDRLEVCTIDF